MEHQETLNTIAEIAVALAGFTGIVVIFGARGAWSQREVVRLRTLLRASLSALFGSFVPIVLSLFDVFTDHLWRWSAGILGVIVLANLTTFLLRSRAIEVPTAQKLYAVVGAVVYTSLLASAFGWLAAPASLFIVGLLWQLFVATQNFVLLLIGGIVADQDDVGR